MMRPHALDGKFEYLKVTVPEESPHLVVVALDRPRQRNAMNAKMWKEIGEAFSSLGRLGDDCRCIILTGMGKAFSGGIDIKDPSMLPHEESSGNGDVARQGISLLPRILEMQQCITAVEQCPVPVIAAIHGNCIGAGIDLTSCCDMRLAQVGSTFSVREVRVGLAADVGTLQRFPKVTGNDSRVRELCFTGDIFDHQEALRIGFVSRVCQDVMGDAIKLGTNIASHSPVAVLGTKRSLVYSRDHTVAEGLDHIASHNTVALMTSDLPTAVVAASTKQQPKFKKIPQFSRL